MDFEFTPPPVDSLEPEAFTPPPLDSLEPMTDRDSRWLKLSAERNAVKVEQDIIDDSSALRRVVADPAIALAKGIVALPEAAVGVANIVSKGRAGKAMEDAGFKFREAKDILSSYQTGEQQMAQGRVAQAKGFIPTVQALVENPTVAVESIIESLPLMFGGGAFSQAALKGIAAIGPKFATWAAGELAPVVAGAVGEGVVGAGSAAENIRQQSPDGFLTWEQAGYAAASGAGTAAFGILGGKVAQKLGLEDWQTAMARGGTSAAQKVTLPKFKAIIAGALQEGALEELPQSAQEQMFSNLALGKPWDQGLAEAAAQGFVAGAAMGGVVQASRRGQPAAGPTPPPLPTQPAPVAPTAPATPPATAPAAPRPTPAPVVPPMAPIQQAASPTPAPRPPIAPTQQPAPIAAPLQPVPPAVFPPIMAPRRDAGRVAADQSVQFNPTEPLPPNEARMVSAGAKILAKQGFDPETAAEFAEHFVRNLRGEPASMEVFRTELVNSASQSGLVNPNTAKVKNTSVEGLVGSGVPRERAEQVAKENALFNEARARQVTLSNREVLKRIPRVYPIKQAQTATPAVPVAESPRPATTHPVQAVEALRQIAAASGNGSWVDATQDGTFAGTDTLNMDADGNVILTRFAQDEDAITKGGLETSAEEMAEVISAGGRFGGTQVPTSGGRGWEAHSFGGGGAVGKFKIPLADVIRLIKSGKIGLASIGNAEFVLSGDVAAKYLFEVNGRRVTPATPKPRRVAITPEAQAAAPSAKGLLPQAFSAKGATDALYEKIFAAASKGKVVVSGIRDPIAVEALPLIQSGLIKSPVELKQWVQDGRPRLLAPPAARVAAPRLENRPEASMPARPVAELGIERGRVSPVDPDLAAAVEAQAGYVGTDEPYTAKGTMLFRNGVPIGSGGNDAADTVELARMKNFLHKKDKPNRKSDLAEGFRIALANLVRRIGESNLAPDERSQLAKQAKERIEREIMSLEKPKRAPLEYEEQISMKAVKRAVDSVNAFLGNVTKPVTPSTQPPNTTQEQAPVEVLRNQPPGTPAKVAEGKPGEVSQAAREGGAKADFQAVAQALKSAYPFQGVKSGSEERAFISKAKRLLKPLGVPADVLDRAVESQRRPGNVVMWTSDSSVLRGLLKQGWIKEPSSIDPGEQQVLDEIAKLKSVTGPLNSSERIDLNELRLSAQNKKLSRLSQAYLENLEERGKGSDQQLSLGPTPSSRPAPSLSVMGVEKAVRELFPDGNTPPNFQVTHNYGKTFKAKFPLGTFDGVSLSSRSSQAPTSGESVVVVLQDGTKVGTYDPNTGELSFTASAPAAGAELFFQQARTVRGWYDPDTGTIWLNAAYLRSPQEARAVFVEEAFHAIQNDKAVQKELSRLVASLTPEQLAEARSAYGNISEEQLRMEAVADILEKQQLTQEQRGILARIWDAVLGAVQRLYGKFTGKVFTERDVQDVLAKALKAASEGKRTNVGGQTIFAANAVVVPPNKRDKAFSLTAHHGTPHLVDKFTTSKIGTGEGAQAYGWGLYFAENELVARDYKKNLSGEVRFDGQDFNRKDARHKASNLLFVASERFGDGARLQAIAEADERSQANTDDLDFLEESRAVASILRAGTEAKRTVSSGRLYTVTLNVEPEDLLDWDKPLSEQSEKVQKALDGKLPERILMLDGISGRRYLQGFSAPVFVVKVVGALEKHGNPTTAWRSIEEGMERVNTSDVSRAEMKRVWDKAMSVGMSFDYTNRNDRSGRSIYEMIAKQFKSSTAEYDVRSASGQLASLGIKGIRYLDQGSRGTGAGTYNYVIFNEEDIKITHANGQPVTVKEAQAEQALSVGSPQNQLDKTYFEAVQRGDLKEAQRLVDEAAKAAGYNVGPVWHGSPDFQGNSFNREFLGETTGVSRGGFNFTKQKDAAEAYTKLKWASPEQSAIDDAVRIANRALLSIQPTDGQQQSFESEVGGDISEMEFNGRNVDDLEEFKDYLNSIGEWMNRNGFSNAAQQLAMAASVTQRSQSPRLISAFLKDPKTVKHPVDGRIIYIAENPNQIKSADPITYDDQGQPIPLSQRFQQESPDIRYSLGGPVKGIANENTRTIRGDDSSGVSQESSQDKQGLRPLYQDQGFQAGDAGLPLQDRARVAKDLEGSGAVLWGTEPEVQAAYLDSNRGADQSGDTAKSTYRGDSETERGSVYPGTKATGEGVSGKPRVLITRTTESPLLRGQSNSDILAHRFLFGAAKASNHGNFNVGLFQKLPNLRIVFEPVGTAPLAAYSRDYDTIVINQKRLNEFDLSNPATAALLDAVISEELIHAAVNRLATNEEILAAWTGLNDMERKTVKDIYGITNPVDGFTDIQFANEYLRLVLQQRLSGKTTEQAVPISSQLKKILARLVDFLKRSFGNKPENSVARQLVERIEGAIRGDAPIKQSLFPSSGEMLATNISQSDATEVQGRAIEPSIIAAASRSVEDLGRQQFEEFEQAGRQLEGLAYESKQFRQARSELNNLVSLHEGRLRQLPQDRVTDDMRANIRDGVSIENFEIVVGDELVTKLAQMGVQARPELVKAMQAEVYFEQQARRLVDNLGKLATLKELKDYYILIKAPADEILKLDKLIAAKEKVVATLTPVTTDRGGGQQSIGERAGEITRANTSKVELQSKRDALNLEPVQEFFGKGITELRDLSEKAKAAADLTRALMDSSTSISEVARLGEIYDKWASFDATVKDALKKGTLTDEQRVSVLTSLQQSFNEFDEAKFRMDDLFNSEEKGLLKDIRLAEADIADAKVTSGLADVLVADALKAAKGEMGLTGTVGDAANISNLEASTGAITTLAMNLGQTIDQNRWLYNFLMVPGSMPAFGASVAQSLGISETALREILKVVQQSPSLASAIVTLTDDAAAKLANSPPLQMQAIAQLATSGNPVGMALAANLTSQIVQQANAQGTKANAARQTAARQLAQSVLRLRTLQQGQALFNQTANSPAFQQLRSAVAAGAAEAQKMVVLGPTGPVLRGFKSAAKEYQPELKINVESNALELQKTREKVWKYLQNAEQYVEDYEAAAASYAANPANPSPSQLGFDVADYNGLKFAIESDIWPMFLNMGDMDDAARAGQYLTPVAVRKLMKAPMFAGQIFLQYEQLGKMIGGFTGNIFRQQIAKYKRGYLNAKKVASQFQDLPKLQSAAMQSHNIRSEDTYRKIFNEMAHYGRLFGSPMRIGFKLPSSGQVVTKEDMEFFKRTLAFEERLRREVTEIDPVTGVRFKRGNKEITRKGAYVGDKGMPRHLNRGATGFIAEVTDAYAGTPKGFTPTTDLSANSQDGVAAFWNKNVGTLKQHILDSLRTDRSFKQSAEMAAAEKKIAARWLAGNMDQVNSVQDLVDLIAAEIPATSGGNPLNAAREGLNNELLQYLAHAERIQKERAEDNAKTSGLSIALSSENEYTKPAAYLELPSEYYDYGALSSVDRITAQARANHSSLVDFANSLRLAIKELQSRMDQLRNATTDKQREAILENYKGNPQEMEDALELLTTSLKNFEDSYRAGGPDIVPTKLGQKLLKATVGSVLAKFEIAIRNLSQGQIQVVTNAWAMNYMSAKLAAWKALSNVPRGLVNTSYLVARNIAGFADRRLGRDPQFQRTLKGAVDVLADGIFKSAQLALLKPRIGAANVRASFDRVNALGFDTSNDWWEVAKQAWTESGQFRNQMEEDKAMKTRAGMAKHFMERLANTGLDAINAFVRGSVLESSDTNMNALSLGLVGNMEQRLEEVAMVFGKRLTDAGITEIDPANKDSILKASEWLPSMNQQTAVNSLGEIRKFLESSASSEGFHLEKNLLKYYQDKMAGKPAEIFNQRTFDAVQRSMIAENNAALPTNRASAGQASTLWRTLLTLQGYPADAFLKLLRITTGGSRERNKVLQAASKISLALGIAAMAIVLQGAGDAGSELWKRKMQGKRADRPTPLDADFYTDPDHLKRAMGRYLMMSAYYLGNAMEAAYGWVDGRTTIDPTQRVFAITTVSQILRDIVSGAKIAKKGGSTAEVLEPLRKSMTRLTFAAPELENLLGKERDNTEAARRGITENAKAKDFDLPAPGFGGTVGLTNVKRKALSQAVSDMDIAKRKGDTEGYNKAKAEAQKQITELEAYYLKQRLEAGDSREVAAKTAKASAWGDYQENNPVTAALGGKRPTAEQYKQLVESSTGERGAVIRQGIKAWQDGAQALFGKPGNITKEDVAENRPGGTVREPSYGRVSLTGGVSGRMVSVGSRSSRGRRAKIRRVSLTGRRRKISPMRSRRKKIRRVRLTA